MDIPTERSALLASRTTEAAKLEVLQSEVDRYERDAVATRSFAPGYQEAKFGRDRHQRAIEQLDGRLESLERRRGHEINRVFRNLVLKHYADAQRLLELATLAVDPDGGPREDH